MCLFAVVHARFECIVTNIVVVLVWYVKILAIYLVHVMWAGFAVSGELWGRSTPAVPEPARLQSVVGEVKSGRCYQKDAHFAFRRSAAVSDDHCEPLYCDYPVQAACIITSSHWKQNLGKFAYLLRETYFAYYVHFNIIFTYDLVPNF